MAFISVITQRFDETKLIWKLQTPDANRLRDVAVCCDAGVMCVTRDVSQSVATAAKHAPPISGVVLVPNYFTCVSSFHNYIPPPAAPCATAITTAEYDDA